MIPEYRTAYLRQALGDRYLFEGFLGKGAFAAVYLVRNRRLERLEALKVLAESYDGDDHFARRFEDEAKLMASLSHPNIVQVHDYGEVGGVLWYSMQYVEGPTLRKELGAHRRMQSADIAALAIPLLDALSYSHERGIVHRDIKPGNILLSPSGRPFLMDFGIAKVTGSALETQTGSVMGTPTYIAPEQALGDALDSRCDLYSFGTTLYELAAGYAPFTSSDPMRTLFRRLKEDPAPLRESYPDVDPELERIILRSLEQDPDRRYQTAEAMAQDLRARFETRSEPWRFKVQAASDPYESLEPLTTESDVPVVDPQDPSELRTRVVAVAEPPQIQEEATQGIGSIHQADGSHETDGIREMDPTRNDVAPDESTVTVELGQARPVARQGLTVVLMILLVALGWWLGQRLDSDETGTIPVSNAVPPPAVLSTAVPEPETSVVEDSVRPDAVGQDPVAQSEPGASRVEDGGAPGTKTVEDAAPEQGEAERPEEPEPGGGPKPRPSAPSQPRHDVPPNPGSADRVGANRSTEPVIRRAVSIPRILRKVDPVLPREDAERCVGERILITVVVNEEGRADSVRAHGQGRPVCVEAATSAARAYDFSPAKDFEGLPVSAPTTISIDFESLQ